MTDLDEFKVDVLAVHVSDGEHGIDGNLSKLTVAPINTES